MKIKFKKCGLWICSVVATLCLTSAIVVSNPVAPNLKADTGETYDVKAITADEGSSATTLFIVDVNGDGNTWGTEGGWGNDNIYTFKPNSGAGLTLNGTPLTTTDIKQPGSLYIGLGVTAEDGDVFIIDGTYYNESKGKTFIFDSCALKFDGTTWKTCTAYSMSSVSASGDAHTLTLTRTDEKTFTAGQNLNFYKGGIFVNDVDATDKAKSIKTTQNGITFEAKMDDAVADVVFISGLLEVNSSYYLIPESYFMWTGESWRTLSGYDAIISRASSKPGATNAGFSIAIKNNTNLDWVATERISGYGLKLNGKPLTNGAIKFVQDSIYVDLATSASVGDILTINGLYKHSSGAKVLFAPTQALRWTGTEWEHLDYTTYDLDYLVVADESSQAGSDTTKPNNLYITRAASSDGWIPVNSWSDEFTYESGANVKKNGVEIDYKMKSVGGNLFLEFSNVEKDDVISVGGTFVCESQDARYAIAESYFKWNGEAWEKGEAYFKTIIDTLNVDENNNTRIGFYINTPHNVGIETWDNTLALMSGDGILVNGEKVDGALIKPIGNQLFVDVENMPIHSGDVLTIEGTYKLTLGEVTTEIVFDKIYTLKWNGMIWATDDYTTYNIGALVLHANSSVGGASNLNNILYLQRADGEALPVLNWNVVFTYESGDGFRVNDEIKTPSAIKSTGDGFYWEFDAVSSGDTVSVGGSFVCEAQKTRYIIDESYFDWTGSKWESDVFYTATHTITHLQPTWPSTSAGTNNITTTVYLKTNGNGSLPVQTWDDDKKFTLRKGDGLMVNGEPKTIYEMKSTGDGLWLRFDAVPDNAVVSLSGTFVCKTLQTKYVIVESTFIFDGEKWIASTSYSDDELEYYDTVTTVDFGWGLGKEFTKTTDAFIGTTYTQSADNTTGSIKLRFNYYSTDVGGNEISIRLRGTDVWTSDIHVRLIWSGIEFAGAGKVAEFASNTTYLIELGAITIKDSTDVWAYIKVDGVLVGTKTLSGATSSNNVSVYVGAIGDSATMSDPDHVAVTYDGGSPEYVEKGAEYQLSTENTSGCTFIGWLNQNTVYQAGETINIGEENLEFTTLALDFMLKEGASIRLATTADESGIRFTAMINTAELNALKEYGVTVSEYGMLILPNDYLSGEQAPNLTDFVAGQNLLKIVCEYQENVNAYTQYYGAMKKLYTKNYGRDFAGRGYITVTYADGSTKTIYTQFGEKNVRSVRFVAQALTNDIEEYEKLSTTKKEVVRAFAESPVYTPKTVNAVASSVSLEENYAAAYVYGNKEHQA